MKNFFLTAPYGIIFWIEIKKIQDDDDSDENDDKNRPDKPARLMIAVGVPAFDKQHNYKNGKLTNARLLGLRKQNNRKNSYK